MVTMIPAPVAPATAEWPPPRRPRLARLDVQGFKSFANRTTFAFESGITAIVGPNGSGKSNVADAVRWVLGEQGTGNLRAKRTEDVIFAGGQGRAAAGFVEATLSLDNADGWLPVDFAEVTVTRRADRSGDSQYLINNRRVRLKDVLLLTASLGQSHVVVGQGLVDAALSQRPEERRGLFEHAANLTGLRLKVAEAERNLAETSANSTRLQDLLAEIEPRLKHLERAARQAQEWQGVRDRLRALQHDHFAALFRTANLAVAEASAEFDRCHLQAAVAQADAARLEDAVESAVTALKAARTAMSELEAETQATADRARRLAHDRELTAERIAALARRRNDMVETETGLREQADAVAVERKNVAATLSEVDRALADERVALADASNANRAAQARRAGLESEVRASAERAAAVDRRASEIDRSLDRLRHQREVDAAEHDRLVQEATARSERLAELERERGDIDRAAVDATDQARMAEANLTSIDHKLAENRGALSEITAAIAERDRRIGQTSGRWEGLRRLQESGAGLHAGVREILRATAAGEIAGVRGTLGALIDVPPDLDTAVEVALGSRLQDFVVDHWVDAERAIAHLKRTGSGRATFQPIETVRSRNTTPAITAAHVDPHVRGVAADLVASPPDVRGVVEALLGRTLVVDALPTARSILPTLPAGWSVVTIAGEVARSGGSVTGGSPVRQSGLLERERDIRRLPVLLSDLEREQSVARRERTRLEDVHVGLQTERSGYDAMLIAARTAEADRKRQRQRLAEWRSELLREASTGQVRLQGIADRSEAVDAEVASLEREHQHLVANRGEGAAHTQATTAALSEALAALVATEQALAGSRARLSGAEERARLDRRREAALATRAQALAHELALRGERSSTLASEQAALAETLDRLNQDSASLAEATRESMANLDAARQATLHAEAIAADLDAALTSARHRVLDAERQANARGFDRDRAIADLEALARRIRDELGCDDPATLFAAEQACEGSGDETNEVSLHPPADHLLEREREIDRLKDRLRRIGYAGDDAIETFERESAHLTHIKSQLDDVEHAAASLRGVVADLHQTMRRRFDDTVADVAVAFSETFAELFGGGSARLAATDGEQTGVDIVAQPPGKRPQSLALLSGGERALTGAALLFAILRVNPAPFCLLDEVDAALDEANVLRFREQLRALAARTQVIVVTHNRGTIETADTLYGVTMGADGVSQVLSLRLDQAKGNAAD